VYEIIRFGISTDSTLLGKFDQLIGWKGYTNRPEALRDLIHDSLVQAQGEEGSEETLGTITIAYRQHTRDLSDGLTQLEQRDCKSIVSTTHIHLDDHDCLEVLIVKGKGEEIKKISDRLTATEG
jgi:CopG family nickel-responsive transcriptional regulator